MWASFLNSIRECGSVLKDRKLPVGQGRLQSGEIRPGNAHILEGDRRRRCGAEADADLLGNTAHGERSEGWGIGTRPFWNMDDQEQEQESMSPWLVPQVHAPVDVKVRELDLARD